MKCIKCKKEATHDSPKNYCAYHWAKWWADGFKDIMTPKEVKEEFERAFKKATEKVKRK